MLLRKIQNDLKSFYWNYFKWINVESKNHNQPESRNHIERRSAAAILLKSGCDESRRERRILIEGEPICKPFCVLNATVVSIYSRHNCKQSRASQLRTSTFITPCGLGHCSYSFAPLCTSPCLVLTHGLTQWPLWFSSNAFELMTNVIWHILWTGVVLIGSLFTLASRFTITVCDQFHFPADSLYLRIPSEHLHSWFKKPSNNSSSNEFYQQLIEIHSIPDLMQ